MAVPAIATISITAGFIAADVTPGTYGTTNTVLISVGGAVIVASIGAVVQVWNNRSRNRNTEPQLTPETRLAIVEYHIAELERAVHEIEEHVRPWDHVERRRR